MIKYVITTFICIVIMSCNFFDKNTQKYRKIALEWHNRQIILPTRLPDKGICCDTLYPVLTTKKYKIFTYIDTLGCTACNFGALAWKQLIHEADSLNYDVAFLFYAHLKNYTSSVILFFMIIRENVISRINYHNMYSIRLF